MYAVIETGGKQFKVSVGDVIRVEKLAPESGKEYKFKNVLILANGNDVKFGAPYVRGVSVKASIIRDGKAKKVIVYKYKSKKGFHKKKGHKQPFTEVRIEAINA